MIAERSLGGVYAATRLDRMVTMLAMGFKANGKELNLFVPRDTLLVAKPCKTRQADYCVLEVFGDDCTPDVVGYGESDGVDVMTKCTEFP